jgi:hypothetical protein
LKRLVFSTILVVSLVALSFLFFTPAAHAQTYRHTVNMQANATGGGCSSDKTNGTGTITVASCVSYNDPNVESDAYAKFHPLSGHGGVSGCSVRINLYHGSTLVAQNRYNCAVDAASGSQNAHYGPYSYYAVIIAQSYSSITQIVMDYSDGYSTQNTSYASPTVTI